MTTSTSNTPHGDATRVVDARMSIDRSIGLTRDAARARYDDLLAELFTVYGIGTIAEFVEGVMPEDERNHYNTKIARNRQPEAVPTRLAWIDTIADLLGA